MNNLEYKGYLGSVEYSNEDNCLYGKVLGISKNGISYEGQTIDELKADFEGAVDAYLKHCQGLDIQPENVPARCVVPRVRVHTRLRITKGMPLQMA